MMMTWILRTLALLALLLTVGPPLLFLSEALTLQSAQWLMLAGTLLWFPCAILLMKPRVPESTPRKRAD